MRPNKFKQLWQQNETAIGGRIFTASHKRVLPSVRPFSAQGQPKRRPENGKTPGWGLKGVGSNLFAPMEVKGCNHYFWLQPFFVQPEVQMDRKRWVPIARKMCRFENQGKKSKGLFASLRVWLLMVCVYIIVVLYHCAPLIPELYEYHNLLEVSDWQNCDEMYALKLFSLSWL